MSYNRINNIGGWSVFIFSLIVYILTLEPTTSLWDCGEYISTSYKLEVGHPPGAPFFMMMGRLFSWFVSPENVAYMINLMSALCSAFTILFLFWTITAFGRKLAEKASEKIEGGVLYAIMGSGLIGSLAYTFSDSFWFSAVEAEVYAMSSFFTAIVFWAIMKWERVAHEPGSDRWLILIMFLIGLSVGVHLLNLLAIPAIGYIYYFKKYKETTPMGIVLSGVISLAILVLLQNIIIPKTIDLGEVIERFFVNGIGMPFYSGTIFFFFLITGALVFGLYYTKRKNKVLLNTALTGLTVFLIGYSCFAMIVIRSNANPPIDENAPKDFVSFSAYLKREQYGDWPILYGQYFNSNIASGEEWTDRSPVHMRRFVVSVGDKELKGFKSEENAKKYAENYSNATIEEKYFLVNDGKGQKPAYDPDHMTFFPRMYSQEDHHINEYKKWSRYENDPSSQVIDNRSGQPKGSLPTFGENLTYFFSYQIGWMYWRYFFWNFVGRQNDEQGYGDPLNGNWYSGLSFIDSERLGNQSLAPSSITDNPGHNTFYFLPLILGLIGFFYHAFKHTKDWFVILLLFLFTGLAIIVYLNQKPMEPRERDYAYVGSFYAFAIWIGLSVYGLFSLAKSLDQKASLTLAATALGTGVAFWLAESATDNAHTFSYAVFFISIIGIAMYLVVKAASLSKNAVLTAAMAILITLPAPIIMGVEGWDDHNRSNRYTASAVAHNYLTACDDGGIIFTHGDNDTFPLWYIQEVEGFKTSVRVCNLSLLNTDWYVDQMKRKAYDSEPLPISFTEEQYRNHNNRDYIYLQPDPMKMTKVKIDANPDLFNEAFKKASSELANLLSNTPFAQERPEAIAQIKTLYESRTFDDYVALIQRFAGEDFRAENNLGEDFVDQVGESLNNFVTAFDYLPLDYAMSYLEDDNNLTSIPNGSAFVLPSRGFVIQVDKKKVIESGYLPEYLHDEIVDFIRFQIPKSGLYKADLMILNMIANNNWERPIYFASSAGPSTYLGLQDYFLMEGLVYKFAPVKGSSSNPNTYGKVHKEVMFENLMNKFVWGNMDVPGTLIDYYNRRITNNYQIQFHVLADEYLSENEMFAQTVKILKKQIEDAGTENTEAKIMSPDGPISIEAAKSEIKKLETSIEENKLKAEAIIDRCMEVMPLVNLAVSRITTSLASVYFQADAHEKGLDLTKEIVKNYSENLDYYLSFENSKFIAILEDVFIAWRSIGMLHQITTSVIPQESYEEEINAVKEKYAAGIKAKIIELSADENAFEYMNEVGQYFGDLMREIQNEQSPAAPGEVSPM